MNYYIYIFEFGEVCYSDQPPTPVDLQCIGAGTLQVIHVGRNTPLEIAQYGSPEVLPKAVLEPVKNPYHRPPFSNE